MNEKELEVLEQYDIDVKSTRKVRGAVLCETKQGLFLLKEMRSSEKQIPALYEIHLHLKQQGYENVDMIQKNKEDAFWSVSEDETKYTLRSWFYGKECDNKKESDIMQGVQNLALLHRILIKPPGVEVKKKEDLEQEFFRHNRELKKVRTFIRDKVGKGEFELFFLKHFDAMYNWAVCASERLQRCDYESLKMQSDQKRTLVHGDYNYHNILLTPTGIATTNFEHLYEGIQIADFYYFLRKTMEKNQWDVRLGHKMIECYNRILPFSPAELEYLSVCIAYPEKFWKVANSYYRSRKSWISAKSLEKLELAVKQTEEKKNFLETLFSFRL